MYGLCISMTFSGRHNEYKYIYIYILRYYLVDFGFRTDTQRLFRNNENLNYDINFSLLSEISQTNFEIIDKISYRCEGVECN